MGITRCKLCSQNGNVATYAWQPFGPGEQPWTFTFLGSHYRGFTVIKVCDSCRGAIEGARGTGRPYCFIHRDATGLSQWYAIMPSGEMIKQPFDVSDLKPVIAGAH